jgi:radical SAM protein with 4Fe4S-binding SPASM domain
MATHSRTQRHGRARQAGQTDPFFAKHGWTQAPRLVQWMTTLRCPLSCEHCLAAGDDAEDMSFHDAARLIEQVAELGVEEFLLTGGEPLTRRDLPEIIGVLRANGVRWSLNTALMPDRRTREAITQHPPGFVAVSVDGPEKVHDAFRGRAGTFQKAMESIAYFSEVAPGAVAAGTTVTARNVEHLPTTFGVVLESGASQWGLHLTVPEGRAAERRDLLLSRPQLKQLLRFAAAKRQYFPVTMADEIGYCGFWEPLLRGEPFFCGAGKAQCVVLPDGEVVPCTTLDRSTSAGNVLHRPLREIWEHGFAELRNYSAKGKCRSCHYASACEGGCWLQRRHGTQCFRDVWHVPQAVTAAGLAVCIGLAAAGQASAAEAKTPPERPVLMSNAEAARMQILQRSIMSWYASRFGGRRTPDAEATKATLRKAMPDGPGAKYFLDFAAGERLEKIEDRAKAIRAALKTKQRSLCLTSLAWRDVTEWCIEKTPPEERTDAERKALREIIAEIGKTAKAWRAEIFKNKLDPFLRRPRQYRRFFASKAGPSAFQRVTQDLAGKRWGSKGRAVKGRAVKQFEFEDMAIEQFLAVRPYGASLDLAFDLKGGKAATAPSGVAIADGKGTLHAFDVLTVPKERPCMLVFGGGRSGLEVKLPAGTELTYGDVLRLTDEQNRDRFPANAFQQTNRAINMPRVYSPLMLPALLRAEREFEAKNENAGKRLPYYISRSLINIFLF